MTTTAAEPGKTEPKANKKPSPRKKRVSAGARVAKTDAAANKHPVTLEGARREMLRLVCASTPAITQAMIDGARQGKYLSAKFLFDVAGLNAKGEELDDVTQRETLASFLLTRWQVAAENGQVEDGKVTEVAEVTPDLAGEPKAPVES